MRKFLSRIFIITGVFLFLLGGYFIWERNSPRRVSFTVPPPEQIGSIIDINNSQSEAKVIKIPSIGKELSITPSKINNGRWESTKNGVSYLATSPLPGEIGNSIIYGHNYPNLLKDLTEVKVGDEIVIVFRDGSEKTFEVRFTQEVGANQSSILNPTSDRRITLYTCSGFLDLRRFVVTAILK